jgi:Phosphate-starvation-inducible E family
VSNPVRPKRTAIEVQSTRLLSWAERTIFALTGILLFVGALAVLLHAASHVAPMFHGGDIIGEVTGFLDLILLTLLLVELAYTVMLSLRGATLMAEPFLIVGLIAVVRRILLISVTNAPGNLQNGATNQTLVELAVLAGVALVFVISIVILRTRPRGNAVDVLDQEHL